MDPAGKAVARVGTPGPKGYSDDMRFLCDEMLGRLARLLRAAGYDTYLAADGEPDAELIKLARREGRVLVTRDKRLAAAAEESVLVGGFGVEAEARSLTRAV